MPRHELLLRLMVAQLPLAALAWMPGPALNLQEELPAPPVFMSLLQVDANSVNGLREAAVDNETGPPTDDDHLQVAHGMNISRFAKVVEPSLKADAFGMPTTEAVFMVICIGFCIATAFGMVFLYFESDRVDRNRRPIRRPRRGEPKREPGQPGAPLLQKSVPPETLQPRFGNQGYASPVPDPRMPMGDPRMPMSAASMQGPVTLARGSVAGQRVGSFDAQALPTLATPPPRSYGDSPRQSELNLAAARDRLSQHGSSRSVGGRPAGALSEQGSHATAMRTNPPPICPGLVLPHCESWFAVDWASLQGKNEFELVGLSGRPLLRTFSRGRPGGPQELRITMCPTRSPILGLASQSGDPNAPYLVRGALGAPYGSIVTVDVNRFALIHEESGAEVLIMFLDGATGHMSLCTMDGMAIAAAARSSSSDFFSGVDHLEVRVGSGSDAVLAMCCLLGAILFGRVALLPSTSLGSPPPNVA